MEARTTVMLVFEGTGFKAKAMVTCLFSRLKNGERSLA